MIGVTYGRGGAGNMSYSSEELRRPTPNDLSTPTIKSDTYTTGRGGSGNMAHNDVSRPELARQAQDVDMPLAVLRQDQPERKVVVGRGGAANVVPSGREGTEADSDGKPSLDARDRSKERSTKAAEPDKPDDWPAFFRSWLARFGLV